VNSTLGFCDGTRQIQWHSSSIFRSVDPAEGTRKGYVNLHLSQLVVPAVFLAYKPTVQFVLPPDTNTQQELHLQAGSVISAATRQCMPCLLGIAAALQQAAAERQQSAPGMPSCSVVHAASDMPLLLVHITGLYKVTHTASSRK
jgi:hypothetical protein